MPLKNYRAESRKSWGMDTEENLPIEKIQLGAILRIADSLETIARDKIKLEQQLKESRDTVAYYVDLAERNMDEIKKLRASKASYKSLYHKMKIERDELSAIVNKKINLENEE